MKNKFAIIFIILLSFILYFLTVRGDFGNMLHPSEYKTQTGPGQAFESSHERSPYALYLALTQNHTYSLTKQQADFGSPDVGYFHGKFFSFFPPGIPLLITPFHSIGDHYNLGQLFSYIGIILFSVLSLVFIFKILRHTFQLPIWASLLGVITYGFATTSWSYSNTIYQHPITIFLITSMFYSIWKYRHSPKLGWIYASYVWIAYALSFVIDYPNALLLLPLMVYFLVSSINIAQENSFYKINFRLTILATFLLFIAFTIWHLNYNFQNYGGYLKFSNTLPRYTSDNLDELQHQTTQEIASKANLDGVFKESNIVNGIHEITIAPDKGMFFYSPILILALVSIYLLRKKITLELGTLLAIAVVDIFMYSSFGDPWGGWAFGPRYAIPAMAALSMILAIGMAQFAKKIWVRIIVFSFLAYSSAVALLGAVTTNVIPPKIEAVSYHLKYGLPASWQYFKSGTTGSFIFKHYLSHFLSLEKYTLIIYLLLLLLIIIILFVLPKQENHPT